MFFLMIVPISLSSNESLQILQCTSQIGKASAEGDSAHHHSSALQGFECGFQSHHKLCTVNLGDLAAIMCPAQKSTTGNASSTAPTLWRPQESGHASKKPEVQVGSTVRDEK